MASCFFSSGAAGGPLFLQDVQKWWLYSVGLGAEHALVGEVIRGDRDSHSSGDIVEHQQLAEGCWEVTARIVPSYKDSTGRPQ